MINREKKGRAGALRYISDVPARNQSACWTDEKLTDRHARDLHISIRGWEEGSGRGRNGCESELALLKVSQSVYM